MTKRLAWVDAVRWIAAGGVVYQHALTALCLTSIPSTGVVSSAWVIPRMPAIPLCRCSSSSRGSPPASLPAQAGRPRFSTGLCATADLRIRCTRLPTRLWLTPPGASPDFSGQGRGGQSRQDARSSPVPCKSDHRRTALRVLRKRWRRALPGRRGSCCRSLRVRSIHIPSR